MIAQVDPIVRLQVLQHYMHWTIERWPVRYLSFDDFFHKKYAYLIPGTIDFIKRIATHCYYCNRLFTDDRTFRKSTDHYTPQSIGQTDRWVISCQDCNCRKANVAPDKLVKQITQAHLRGLPFWGHHGKKLKFIAKQINGIQNDILYGTGPRVYYFKR